MYPSIYNILVDATVRALACVRDRLPRWRRRWWRWGLCHVLGFRRRGRATWAVPKGVAIVGGFSLRKRFGLRSRFFHRVRCALHTRFALRGRFAHRDRCALRRCLHRGGFLCMAQLPAGTRTCCLVIHDANGHVISLCHAARFACEAQTASTAPTAATAEGYFDASSIIDTCGVEAIPKASLLSSNRKRTGMDPDVGRIAEIVRFSHRSNVDGL